MGVQLIIIMISIFSYENISNRNCRTPHDISVLGLTRTAALRLIKSDIERSSNSIVYIHVRPVRFSRLNQSGSHIRCSLSTLNNSKSGEIVEHFE